MIWVPQAISGCDLSRSRVSKVEKIWSPSVVGQHAGAVDIFFGAKLYVQRNASCRHLSSIFSPFMFWVVPTASSVVALPRLGNIEAHQRPEDEVRHVGRGPLLFNRLSPERPRGQTP